MGTVTIEYCGIEATGKNVTAAKQNAVRKLASIVEDCQHDPIILTWRKWSVMVWPSSHGWRRAIIQDDGKMRDTLCSTIVSNREDALSGARSQLAQLGYSNNDPVDFIPDILGKDKILIGDYRTWASFQRRYQEALSRGLKDQDAYDYASKNPVRVELWQNVA